MPYKPDSLRSLTRPIHVKLMYFIMHKNPNFFSEVWKNYDGDKRWTSYKTTKGQLFCIQMYQSDSRSDKSYYAICVVDENTFEIFSSSEVSRYTMLATSFYSDRKVLLKRANAIVNAFWNGKKSQLRLEERIARVARKF